MQKDIYEGAVIGGVRIFPEVYYPYMDKLYFDHANWNRVPKGVGIADVLGHKEKYVFANVKSRNTGTQAEESEKGCGCSGSGCGCKESQHTVLESIENKISGIDLVQVSTSELFEQNLKIPYLWIGYSIKGGISLNQVSAECYCDANQMGVSHCVTNPANKGEWCGKSPCSGAACNCGTKLHPELCK